VGLDELHAEPVSEGEPLDGRQRERTDRSGRRRLAPVGARLRRRERTERHECRGGEGEMQGALHFDTSGVRIAARSFLPDGTTERTMRPGPRKRKAAALTSAGARDR
jgi:hypothetical protein